MKNLFTFCLLFLSISTTAFAQRIVYVDTEYILENMTEYEEAEVKLEEQIVLWNEELLTKENDLIEAKANFKQNELLMPEVKRIEAEEQINQQQNELSKLKMKRFGTKGDLYKKQQDLIKPIQDRIYNAIKQMSEFRDYDMVLDKATGVSILFVKPNLDVSDEVLRIVNNKQ